jgi:hypothetical protein
VHGLHFDSFPVEVSGEVAMIHYLRLFVPQITLFLLLRLHEILLQFEQPLFFLPQQLNLMVVFL